MALGLGHPGIEMRVELVDPTGLEFNASAKLHGPRRLRSALADGAVSHCSEAMLFAECVIIPLIFGGPGTLPRTERESSDSIAPGRTGGDVRVRRRARVAMVELGPTGLGRGLARRERRAGALLDLPAAADYRSMSAAYASISIAAAARRAADDGPRRSVRNRAATTNASHSTSEQRAIQHLHLRPAIAELVEHRDRTLLVVPGRSGNHPDRGAPRPDRPEGVDHARYLRAPLAGRRGPREGCAVWPAQRSCVTGVS